MSFKQYSKRSKYLMEMRAQAKNILGRISSKISMKDLIRISGRKVLLPFYHTISDIPLPHISRLYPVRNYDLFQKDLNFYCRHYEPVDMETLLKIILGEKKLSKPVFHLSFDDGLSEIYSGIAPILEEQGIPATVFVNTDFIDNRQLFYRYKVSLIMEALAHDPSEAKLRSLAQILEIQENTGLIHRRLLDLTYRDTQKTENAARVFGLDFNEYLRQKKPYLTSEEIKNLMKRGFTIGSHSCDHPFFGKLALPEQQAQITQSFDFLQKNFGTTENYFSFPFSDEGVKTDFFNFLYESTGCDLSFGTSGLKDDSFPRHLHRIALDGSLSPAGELIKTEYLYYLCKIPFRKNRISR